MQTACCRLGLTRQTKPNQTKPLELLLGFPPCKRFAGGSRHRRRGPARKRVTRGACSCVTPSSADPGAATSPACRERGGRWETGRREQTSCSGAECEGRFLSQENSPDGGSWRGPRPTVPSPVHRAAHLQHSSLTDSSVQPCQLRLGEIPAHPRTTRARGLAALREMPSKPHKRERQVSTGLPGSAAAHGAAPTAAGIVLGKLSRAHWGAHQAVCAMVSGFASCLGSIRFGSWQLLGQDRTLLQKPEANV